MLRSRRIVPDIPRALRRPRSRPARPDRLQPHRRIARPLQAGAERVPMPPVPAGNDFERLLAPVRDRDSAAGPACSGADRPLDRSVGLAPGLAAAMCARRGSLTAPLRARAARSRRPRSSPGRPPSRSGSAPDPRGRDPGGLHRARGCAPAAGRSPRLAPPCRSGVTGPGALPLILPARTAPWRSRSYQWVCQWACPPHPCPAGVHVRRPGRYTRADDDRSRSRPVAYGGWEAVGRMATRSRARRPPAGPRPDWHRRAHIGAATKAQRPARLTPGGP